VNQGVRGSLEGQTWGWAEEGMSTDQPWVGRSSGEYKKHRLFISAQEKPTWPK